jgi:hypothetical protein
MEYLGRELMLSPLVPIYLSRGGKKNWVPNKKLKEEKKEKKKQRKWHKKITPNQLLAHCSMPCMVANGKWHFI